MDQVVQDPTEPLLLTVPEAAVLLRTGEDRVYTLVRDGELRAHRFGRRVLISRRALDEFADGYAREGARGGM